MQVYFRLERDIGVNFRHLNLTVKTIKINDLIEANGLRQNPSMRLPPERFYARLSLGGEHEFLEGLQLAILGELESAVMRIGGLLKNLDDQCRVEYSIVSWVGKFRLSTN